MAYLDMKEEEIEKLVEELNTTIKDLTADRDSLKKENESLTAQQEKIEKELASTKEMNFTLARQVGKAGSEKKSLDEMLKDFFYGKEKN